MIANTQSLLRPFHVLRDEGLRASCLKTLSHLGFRRVYLLERDLAYPLLELTPAVPLTFDRLEPGHLDEYLHLHHDVAAKLIRQRFADGHSCFAARHRGRLVFTCWLTTGRARLEYLGRDLTCAAGEGYSYDAFTHPDFRGQCIAPVMSVEVLRHCRAAGLRRVIRATLPENRSALRAHAKAGFHPYAVMGYLNLLGWRHDYLRPLKGTEADA